MAEAGGANLPSENLMVDGKPPAALPSLGAYEEDFAAYQHQNTLGYRIIVLPKNVFQILQCFSATFPAENWSKSKKIFWE